VRCPKGFQPAADGDLDDFEDSNTQLSKLGGRDGYWFPASDKAGSTLASATEDGGADGSEIAMHISGVTVSTGADAWGAQIGAKFVSQGLFYDASKYVGIAFKAKAGPKSTRRVRFKIGDANTHPEAGVCKQCWNAFGTDLSLTGDWREYKVLFSDARQEEGWGDPRPTALTPSKLVSIDWSVGPGQTYDLWFDSLVFLECKP
jgi:hypothetical protein